VLPRVIPCLLTEGTSLVKTMRFDEPTYVGDPANVIAIFSEFEVDEIVLLDIAATREGRGPDLSLVARVADECIVPLAYGGGVTSIEQATRILEIGLEKIVVNTGFVRDSRLVSAIAARHGSQAVVVSIDARRVDGTLVAVTRCGREPLAGDPAEWARRAEQAGAGEILVTSIDRDGTQDGFDLELVESVSDAVGIPVIACGGAGERADLRRPVAEAGASAVAAGSIFVFHGRQRAVLVNFPSRRQVRELFA
jgi:imidazole glycerol-phosphate synthase subunit HisF